MANGERNFSFLYSAELARDNKSEEQHDGFWTHEEIEAQRWNQVFPYQLFLVKRGADGSYVRQDETALKWVFTLPFPPESLSISMPFAISGRVTQGGYVEEHNGAPIRMIQLSGTTGILPMRPSAPTVQSQNLAQAIFAGTIQQAKRVATSARNLASNFTGQNSNFTPNLIDEDPFLSPENDETHMAKTSGYYQFRLLQQFFENYANFKKTNEGKEYRLAFAIWKQQAVYLITPVSYTTSQIASSPYEITYNLSFRAYRRIALSTVDDRAANVYKPVVNRPNALAATLKAISDARDVLENSRDILAAVAGDLEHALFEPMRQAMMFLRDLLKVPLAFADLPTQVLKDAQDAVVQFIATEQAFSGASEQFKDRANSVVEAYRGVSNAASASGKAETGVGKQVRSQSVADNVDAAFDPFRNPQDNYNLFKGIKVGQVNLPIKTVRAIANERVRVRKLTRLNFEQMRDSIANLQADFADAVGAGNETFNRTFQRSSRAVSKTPTNSDFRVMFALNRAIMELNRLAASGTTNRDQLKSIDFVAGLARRSGIAFKVPRSKFAVPMPYGVTLEQLATRYLGNPDRWIEIAALNGLRAPYVDEEGFDLTLLVNGNGNQVSVADSSRLYIGQRIWLSAINTSRTIRRITKIEKLSSSLSTITVDGDPDLSRFTTMGEATLHAFLPDTVNSQMTLYMPSDKPPPTADAQTKSVPGLDVYDQLLNAGGFDLLLTPTNDLVITPDGDCKLAVGLQNIVQTARIRLSVQQGSLNRHPTFGLPLKVGMSTADLDAKDLLKAVKNLFVDDPVFTGVQSASVYKNGPTAKIMMSVGVQGTSQYIPLAFDLRR